MNTNFTVVDTTSLEEKISNFLPVNTRIVTDFDSTVTSDNGKTSWSLFADSGLMPPEYVERRQALKDQYFPFEIDPEISDAERRSKMREWWLSHLELFREFKLKSSILKDIVSQQMRVRIGMDSFLSAAHEVGIPTLILSAGISQSIETVLGNNGILSESVSIAANSLLFDEGGICV